MRTLKTLLKSSLGFSMPELLVGVALAGVVGLGISKLVSDSYKNQGYHEGMSEINQVMSIAQKFLTSKKRCDFVMGQMDRSTIFPHPLQELKEATGNDVIRVTTPTINHFKKIKLLAINVVNNSTNIRVKDFIFDFQVKNDPKIIKRTISVLAELKPQGTSYSTLNTDPWTCGGVIEDSKFQAAKALCASLNNPAYPNFAVWDSGTDRCKLNRFECPQFQVAVMLTSLGRVECVNAKDYLLTHQNSIIDPNPVNCPVGSNNIRIEFDSSHFKLVCN